MNQGWDQGLVGVIGEGRIIADLFTVTVGTTVVRHTPILLSTATAPTSSPHYPITGLRSPRIHGQPLADNTTHLELVPIPRLQFTVFSTCACVSTFTICHNVGHS